MQTETFRVLRGLALSRDLDRAPLPESSPSKHGQPSGNPDTKVTAAIRPLVCPAAFIVEKELLHAATLRTSHDQQSQLPGNSSA